MSSVATERDLPWRAAQRQSLIAGAAGLLLWAAGLGYALLAGDEALLRKAFFSYLIAFVTGLAIPLGSLAIWMLHNQTGGAWGQAIRRVLQAAVGVLPLNALMFVPLAFGLPHLYLWADHSHPHEGHLGHLLHYRAWFHDVPFFLVRTALYFAGWIFVAWMLARWSDRLDANPDRAAARRMQVFSGPGLVIWGLGVTFAAVDWLMSLEPDWYSTIYGLLIASGLLLPALAFAIVVVRRLEAAGRVTVDADTWNDLGNLLLAAVLVWAYLSYSQLLLIWSGNLPEEITWYLKRTRGGWEWVGILLAVGYFGLPFALLLSRANKRNPGRLAWLSVLLLGLSVVHYFWLINPVYAARFEPEATHGPLTLHVLDVVAVVGVCGLTFAAFLWQLGRRRLTPPNPPAEEVPQHA